MTFELSRRYLSSSEPCLTEQAWTRLINEPNEGSLRELLKSRQISSGLANLIENLLIEAEIDSELTPLPKEAVVKIYAVIHKRLAGSFIKDFVIKPPKIDWSAALEQLAVEDNRAFTVDGYWGIQNFHGAWKIDPIFENQEFAIAEYFEQFCGGQENLPTLTQ